MMIMMMIIMPVTRLTPSLVPKQTCRDVPREICSNSKVSCLKLIGVIYLLCVQVNPRKVKRPVIRRVCVRQGPKCAERKKKKHGPLIYNERYLIFHSQLLPFPRHHLTPVSASQIAARSPVPRPPGARSVLTTPMMTSVTRTTQTASTAPSTPASQVSVSHCNHCVMCFTHKGCNADKNCPEDRMCLSGRCVTGEMILFVNNLIGKQL